MALKLITAPTVEPVTVAEVKTHSRITGTDDDAYLTLLIKAARNHVENITNRALITQTWDWTLDGGLRDVCIPKAPLQSITSVKYTDDNGTEQTLATSYYKVDDVSEPGRVVLAYSQSWPTARQEINNVTMRFIAGYGDASTDVPDDINFAILWIVDHWYEHRTAVTELGLNKTPLSIDAALFPYRVGFF